MQKGFPNSFLPSPASSERDVVGPSHGIASINLDLDHDDYSDSHSQLQQQNHDNFDQNFFETRRSSSAASSQQLAGRENSDSLVERTIRKLAANNSHRSLREHSAAPAESGDYDPYLSSSSSPNSAPSWRNSLVPPLRSSPSSSNINMSESIAASTEPPSSTQPAAVAQTALGRPGESSTEEAMTTSLSSSAPPPSLVAAAAVPPPRPTIFATSLRTASLRPIVGLINRRDLLEEEDDEPIDGIGNINKIGDASKEAYVMPILATTAGPAATTSTAAARVAATTPFTTFPLPGAPQYEESTSYLSEDNVEYVVDRGESYDQFGSNNLILGSTFSPMAPPSSEEISLHFAIPTTPSSSTGQPAKVNFAGLTKSVKDDVNNHNSHGSLNYNPTDHNMSPAGRSGITLSPNSRQGREPSGKPAAFLSALIRSPGGDSVMVGLTTSSPIGGSNTPSASSPGLSTRPAIVKMLSGRSLQEGSASAGIDPDSSPTSGGGGWSVFSLKMPFSPQQTPRGKKAGAIISSNARASLFVSKLARRSTTDPSGTASSPGGASTYNKKDFSSTPHVVHRRYKTGDFVLVTNHQSRWANLVNRHGFPPEQGESLEERRGPYLYVLAMVKQIHFEETHPYYTVTRCDTGVDQRADVEYMEPIRSRRGEEAALRAATESSATGHGNAQSGTTQAGQSSKHGNSHPVCECVSGCIWIAFWPLVAVMDCLFEFLTPIFHRMLAICKRQAYLFLNGRAPYMFRVRLTAVNLMVLCSSWFMFADQVRLAFLPPTADKSIAIVNLSVWILLALELIIEVFVRPNGYRDLIISDKAYAPSTVRFLNAFHLIVESISLLVFIPEFFCILRSESCSLRYPFSLYNALLMGTIGPQRIDTFCGHAYLALIRLRVFGLVRHWKNMWIANTFINMKWSNTGSGRLFLPSFGSASIQDRPPSLSSGMNLSTEPSSSLSPSSSQQPLPVSSTSMVVPGTNDGGTNGGAVEKISDDVGGLKSKEATLTNASTIGTALMVTNSYRAMGILWVITGIFPIVYSMLSNYCNTVTIAMTQQLQATNMLANDTTDDTCIFLRTSLISWIAGIQAPNYQSDTEPFLLSLELEPFRCKLIEGTLTTTSLCNWVQNVDDDTFGNYAFSNGPGFAYCEYWSAIPAMNTISDIAEVTGIRQGSILRFGFNDLGNLTNSTTGETDTVTFAVSASFDLSYSIATGALASLILQVCLLIGILGGLSVLRRDAEVLVLGPLRRMLKIVARYAKNPLSQPKLKKRRPSSTRRKLSDRKHSGDDCDADSENTSAAGGDDDDYIEDDDLELGSYETEQLITAVAKITDLLRKCWGVAGADIISTNLATREGALTEVFNPTVPGQSVYALFAFAGINGFDHALRSLGGDVMILINDVAVVLHGEVFRWGFGDSGQCNKNLGAAFLLVFRIGLVKEVIEKLEQARDVIFSTGVASKTTQTMRRRGKNVAATSSMVHSSLISSSSHHSSMHGAMHYAKSHPVGLASQARASATMQKRKSQRQSVKAMSLSLQSLPGISTFTDRAVIGMLKSFAGIYRDEAIRKWNNDFRLGAGVGAFSASLIYGMDAGWAVEGAVGSEYKIDATYLSPHVNMASRMMGACKQYGVTIMLSQAVQELMSDVARSKLRHLDTITVKGSSIKQRIYTYDARAKGVDFFLYSRSEEQADVEADRYSPNMWNTDQDLRAMRQHVTDDFLKEFRDGHKAYIAGDWPTAIRKLDRANDIMFETAFEEGYLEDEFHMVEMRSGADAARAAEELKRDNGDGPSLLLVNFMKSHGGVVPERWEGWHPLTRK